MVPCDECGWMCVFLERELGLILMVFGWLGCDMDIVCRSFVAKDLDVR